MHQPCLATTNRHDGPVAWPLRATAVWIAGLQPVALDQRLPGHGFPALAICSSMPRRARRA